MSRSNPSAIVLVERRPDGTLVVTDAHGLSRHARSEKQLSNAIHTILIDPTLPDPDELPQWQAHVQSAVEHFAVKYAPDSLQPLVNDLMAHFRAIFHDRMPSSAVDRDVRVEQGPPRRDDNVVELKAITGGLSSSTAKSSSASRRTTAKSSVRGPRGTRSDGVRRKKERDNGAPRIKRKRKV